MSKKYEKQLEQQIEKLEKKLSDAERHRLHWKRAPKNKNRFDLVIGDINFKGLYVNTIATMTHMGKCWRVHPYFGSISHYSVTDFKTKEEAMQWVEDLLVSSPQHG